MSAYDIAVEHIKGTCNLAADCLSRLPVKLTDKQDAAIVKAVHANERELFELLPITALMSQLKVLLIQVFLRSRSLSSLVGRVPLLPHSNPATVAEKN